MEVDTLISSRSLTRLGTELHRRVMLGEQNPANLLLSPDFVSPKQRAFLTDNHNRKSLLSGRRCGKSFCFARQLFLTAVTKPGSNSVFVGITRQSAKDIIWLELLTLLERLNLDAEVNHTELRIVLRNGSSIRVTGCSDSSELARFRGVANDCVCLDEVQDWASWLDRFCREVIEPTLIDRNGMLCLGGTPNEKLFGYFYEITGPFALHTHYRKHNFNLYDNVFFGKPSQNTPWSPAQALERVKEELQKAIVERGLTETHNIYITEYLGKWPTSASNLLYADFTAVNMITVPPVGWERGFLTLGLDLGFKDHSAFVLIHQNIQTMELTAIQSWSKPGMIIEQVATELRALLTRHPDLAIVMDEGAMKMIAESLAATYELPVRAAIKSDKKLGISLLNSDFRLKNISVVAPNCPELVKQLQSVQWDKKRQKEHEGQKCDEVDAFLYAYRSFVVNNCPLPVTKSKTVTNGPMRVNPNEGREHFERLINQRKNLDTDYGVLD